MAIPLPAGVPLFHIEGHTATDDSQYSIVRYPVGGSRSRRVTTAAEKFYTVRWLLEPEHLATVIDWHEYDLKAGSLSFNAQVKSQTSSGLEELAFRWVNFSVQMLHKGRGMVSGLVMAVDDVETDPYFDDVLLLLSGNATGFTDSSTYNRAIGTTGAPVFNTDVTLFGNQTYGLTNTEHRITIDDTFVNTVLLTNAWALQMWIYPTTAGSSNNFMAIGPIVGTLNPDLSWGWTVTNINGSTYGVDSTSLTANEWAFIELVRDKSDGVSDYLKLYKNKVLVDTSASFNKLASIPQFPGGAGFGQLFGYFTIGPIARMSEMRFTLNNTRQDEPLPTAPFPIG